MPHAVQMQQPISQRSTARDVLAACDDDLHFIRPSSGLSADYLNLISSFVMMLQLVPEDDEVRREISAWRPVGYREHYVGSPLPQAREAVARYDGLPAGQRDCFEQMLGVMHDLAAATLRALEQARSPADAAAIAALSSQTLNHIIQHVGCFVNEGRAPDLNGFRRMAVNAIAALLAERG